ncbi:MAG TPA: hypothetical protein VKE42_05125 [Candidatus Cybelea sp.]|nr:hypothetical protein [Candidatus Cybelea sp.]
MNSTRRVLYTHDRLVALVRSVRVEDSETRAELQALRRELDEFREVLLVITGTLREQTEQHLAELLRRYEPKLARLARDGQRLLH